MWLIHYTHLHTQASPDGKRLGDCPFTQRANLAMKVKKVNSTYVLIDLSKKPKWFLGVNPAGSAPALQYGDKVIGDSYEIVQYMDATYPNPSLKPPGNQEAEEATGQIFNLFSAYAKHFKEPSAAEAEAKFTAEMEKIDAFLGKSKGPLLCGGDWSVADCSLIPRLYHITTVAEHYMNYNKHKNMTHLMKYMEYTFSTAEFKATDYPKEYILTGWAKYFQ